MTEGGLAAVVAAAAKTRGIGCKGDLVRVYYFGLMLSLDKNSPATRSTPWWSSGDTSVFPGNQDAIGPQTV